jgi:hypothetical protein
MGLEHLGLNDHPQAIQSMPGKATPDGRIDYKSDDRRRHGTRSIEQSIG